MSEVPDELRSLTLGEVSVDGSDLWYRYDFDSCSSDDEFTPDDHFADASDELHDQGWALHESYIEHDCITGKLIRVDCQR